VTKVDANDKVVFGATVEIEDVESEKRVIYQIVGEDEASIKEGRISIGSPIARALIGKQVEDVVTVKAPGGNVDYEIISIEYV
jgi:transcription elongation factor GreA